jgi:signal transduction histidine kinase
MNRLWVRLSLVISSLLLVAALLPLGAFTIFVLTHEPPAAVIAAGAGPPPPFRNPWRDIPLDLLRSFVVAGVLGVAGGILASRLLAAPITQLATAAQAIGAGDLGTRVPPNRSSQEIEELTAAFNKMAADLQHAAELRTSLMADVSHELRTPLTVLEGNLRAALDHVYELDEEQIANLYEQTRHLIRLVNDLRELSLAEAAQLPLDLQPLEIVPLINETAAAFELLAEEKGVRLQVEVPGELDDACADRMRLRQVLHNLLANALRHTPEGGTVTISARAEETSVALAVADSGEGISPQALPHVFDRFYRTDPSRSRETGGSGLGLAIVKALVETQGGRVEAASPGVGQGSVFTLHLPYAQPRAFIAS